MSVDRAETLDCLRDLIKTPSINPDLNPQEGGSEAAVARYAVEWLRGHGITAWIEEVTPGRPNLVAELGGPGPVGLVLAGHLDTVGVVGMTVPPFEPTLEGTRVYGRGAYDMKGGVAAFMEAAAVLGRRGSLSGKVRLALLMDEEYRSLGADHYVAHHPEGTACIIAEPTELAVVPVHKGFQWVEVITHGRQAHGSLWEVGESAIAKMGPVIQALDVFDRTVLRTRTYPGLSAASLHAAVIEGGRGISTYAVECRLEVERRTLPGEDPSAVYEELASLVREAAPDADVRLLFQRFPLQTPEDSRLVRTLVSAGERHLSEPLTLRGAPHWADTAVFSQAGIPAVEFGCRGEGAHAEVEWVDLDSVLAVAAMAVDTAEALDREPVQGSL